ncbi:MAG TPA: HlyD family efflux transporter periplasmic adaptor subunit, partial [Pirellulaceae bacterium]|nr:HlyD family efflux transporter periplasmic adaptor subunit [Pirellulaceae bacterium]
MATHVDLSQLAVNRATPLTGTTSRRRYWLTRWLIPGLIMGGFVSVAAWSLRERLLPSQAVTVVPVILAKADVQPAGTPLFQAAGWIEPRPSAVLASALVEGVVEQMLVVEGQEVERGQPVAKLIVVDADLALREAEANLRLRAAELELAKASLAAAEQNLAQPVHLESALAEADSAHAALDTELKNLPFALRSAESQLKFSQQDLQGKLSISDSIAGRTLQKAQSEFDSATATVEELKQRAMSLQSQHDSTHRKREALRRRLQLKTDEIRARDEAKANVDAAAARVSQADLAVETATLRIERMTIRAPITGRVLSLNAQPGARLMGLNAASQRDASTVVTLYDPLKLQVRADVRLEDLPQVLPGQRVQISTAANSQPIGGHVLMATSSADIQKNTLQVKVAIDNPPIVLKPEMLVQVTFLAPERVEQSQDQQSSPTRLLVPRELVEKGEASAT